MLNFYNLCLFLLVFFICRWYESDILHDLLSPSTPMETRSTECFSRTDTPSSIISDNSESSSSGVQHDKTSSYYRLVRWEEAHVKLLIALWKQFKHLITEGEKSKKDFFTIIAFEVNKKSKE